MKRSPLLGVQPKTLPIRQRFFGASQRALQHELADGPARSQGGSLKRALGGGRQAKVQFLVSRFGTKQQFYKTLVGRLGPAQVRALAARHYRA